MVIVDEFYHNVVFDFSSEQLLKVLQDIKNTNTIEIDVIKEKIRKYEQKRRAHEVWYQSLSPVRKFFAGRPPSHHQAVEYIVNVKERFANIEQIKMKISRIEKVIQLLEAEAEKEQIVLPNFIIEEIKGWKEKGGVV